MQDDPRSYSGFPYHTNAILICLPHICEATLVDVSAHGALVSIETNAAIRVGDEARLRVLTDKGNHAFEVDALVAHRSGRLVGLAFNAMDQHAKNTLHRLIGMNLGDPEFAARSLQVLLNANPGAVPAQV